MSADVEKELSELRKEVYEARTLIIKSDNLLRTLHAEVQKVEKTQSDFEKRHFVGHIAAYVVFGLVGAGIAWYAIDTAVAGRELVATERIAEAEKAAEDAATARATAEHSQAERAAAAAAAQKVYAQLMATDAASRMRGLKAWDALDQKALADFDRQVLGDAASQAARDIAREAFEEGEAAWNKDDAAVAKHLGRFRAMAARLSDEWSLEDRHTAAHHLGASLNKLGKHAEALPVLKEAAASASGRSTRSYLNLLLGDSLEATGKNPEALEAFERALAADPAGRLGPLLRRRIQKLGGRAPPAPPAAAPPVE